MTKRLATIQVISVQCTLNVSIADMNGFAQPAHHHPADFLGHGNIEMGTYFDFLPKTVKWHDQIFVMQKIRQGHYRTRHPRKPKAQSGDKDAFANTLVIGFLGALASIQADSKVNFASMRTCLNAVTFHSIRYEMRKTEVLPYLEV